MIDREQKEFVMMFGNSYKDWQTQFKEFLRIENPKEIINVDYSKEHWIGWGGLKWCEECDFQDELNREGCQENEPNNPTPRIYKNMVFMDFDIIEKKARKIFNENFRYTKWHH